MYLTNKATDLKRIQATTQKPSLDDAAGSQTESDDVAIINCLSFVLSGTICDFVGFNHFVAYPLRNNDFCMVGLVLHSDNGAPMKSSTLLSKLYDLGITPSRGRPRVSNDNPYSESLFRTLKYCPQWPKDVAADRKLTQ